MEDSSVNLLSLKTHTNENNNMLESQKIELYDCEKPLKPQKSLITTSSSRTRVLFVVALVLIVFAILSLIGAIALVINFSGKGDEKITSHNQTSSSTFSPTPSSSIPVPSTSIISPSISTTSTLHPSHTTTESTVSVETSTTSTVISSTVSPQTTTTVTTTTTQVSECDSDKFRCSDGSCIQRSYVCDGKPHCPLADDEYLGCECSENQFRCKSGQCVNKAFRCDKVPQCNDKSDEDNCPNCEGFECSSGQCLWSHSVRCNGHVDCLDLSDEKMCSMRIGYGKCKNGIWIQRGKFCNGVDDCFDNSDEENCDGMCNNVAEKLCGDGKTCILAEWFCDGVPDCPDGSDERNCRTCNKSEWQCSDFSCIMDHQVCDGVKNCGAGDDEINCFQIQGLGGDLMPSGILTTKQGDKSLPVCSDRWSKHDADEICQYLGHGESSGTSFIPQAVAGVSLADGFMMLGDRESPVSSNQSLLAKYITVRICPAQKVVSLSCKPSGCGKRQVDILTPFIVGGTLPPKGKWPWVASVSMLGQGVCGGVVINRKWVLTAAHCVVNALANYTLTPHYFEITAGTNTRVIIAGDRSQRRRVDKIVLHPQVQRLETGLTEWDLALMRVDFPLFFGDYLQPICLPELDKVFQIHSQCYLAGWGYINTQDVTVNKLREGKMRLWEEETCAKDVVDSHLNINATICAGYQSGAISACQGDSGSPLMCLDNLGHWTVVGVMSHGVNGCDGQQRIRANRFARVSTAVDWIRKTTGD